MMRVVFMGTPEFAVPTLLEIAKSGRAVVAVYTRAPARGGRRGLEIRTTPVHSAADSLGIPVFTPASLRDIETQKAFNGLAADVAIVAAYGLILPPAILEAPRLGCLNLHASLLPRWRGAAPIQAAILAGDSETGVTIMQMDSGLDTGAMLLQESVPITSVATAATLHDVLAELGARLMLRSLVERPRAVPQPGEGVTYAAKLSRDSGRIDWTGDARAIERQVRAFDPWPGTFTTLRGNTLKVLAAELYPE